MNLDAAPGTLAEARAQAIAMVSVHRASRGYEQR